MLTNYSTSPRKTPTRGAYLADFRYHSPLCRVHQPSQTSPHAEPTSQPSAPGSQQAPHATPTEAACSPSTTRHCGPPIFPSACDARPRRASSTPDVELCPPLAPAAAKRFFVQSNRRCMIRLLLSVGKGSSLARSPLHGHGNMFFCRPLGSRMSQGRCGEPVGLLKSSFRSPL